MSTPAPFACDFCALTALPDDVLAVHNGVYLLLMPDNTYVIAPRTHVNTCDHDIAMYWALRELTSRALLHARNFFGIMGGDNHAMVIRGHFVVAVVPHGAT